MDLSPISLVRYFTPGAPPAASAPVLPIDDSASSNPAEPEISPALQAQTTELKNKFQLRDDFARAQLEKYDHVCATSCTQENPSLQEKIAELEAIKSQVNISRALNDRRVFNDRVLNRAEIINEYLLDRLAILSLNDSSNFKDRVMAKRAAVFGLVRNPLPFTSGWLKVKGLPVIDPSVAESETMLRETSYLFFQEVAEGDEKSPYTKEAKEILALIEEVEAMETTDTTEATEKTAETLPVTSPYAKVSDARRNIFLTPASSAASTPISQFQSRYAAAKAQLDKLGKVCGPDCFEEDDYLRARLTELEDFNSSVNDQSATSSDQEWLGNLISHSHFLNEYILDRLALMSINDTSKFKDSIFAARVAAFDIRKLPMVGWVNLNNYSAYEKTMDLLSDLKLKTPADGMTKWINYRWLKEVANSDGPYSEEAKKILAMIPTYKHPLYGEEPDYDENAYDTLPTKRPLATKPERLVILRNIQEVSQPEPAPDKPTPTEYEIELGEAQTPLRQNKYPKLKGAPLKIKLNDNLCYKLRAGKRLPNQIAYNQGSLRVFYQGSASDEAFAPIIRIRTIKRTSKSLQVCVDTREVDKVNPGAYDFYIQKANEGNATVNHVGQVIVSAPPAQQVVEGGEWDKPTASLIKFLKEKKNLHVILKNNDNKNGLYEVWSDGDKVFALSIESNGKRKPASDPNFNRVITNVLGTETVDPRHDTPRSDELLKIVNRQDNDYAFIKKEPARRFFNNRPPKPAQPVEPEKGPEVEAPKPAAKTADRGVITFGGLEPFTIHRGQKLSYILNVDYKNSSFRYKKGETFADYGNNDPTALPPINVVDVSTDGTQITVEIDAMHPALAIAPQTYRIYSLDEKETKGIGKFRHFKVMEPLHAMKLRIVEGSQYPGVADLLKTSLTSWASAGQAKLINLYKKDKSGYYQIWFEGGDLYGMMFDGANNPQELDTISLGEILEKVLGPESRKNSEWKILRDALKATALTDNKYVQAKAFPAANPTETITRDAGFAPDAAAAPEVDNGMTIVVDQADAGITPDAAVARPDAGTIDRPDAAKPGALTPDQAEDETSRALSIE